MATKQQYLDYIALLQIYIKELKAWVKDKQDGEITTADGLETPPKPPPNP